MFEIGQSRRALVKLVPLSARPSKTALYRFRLSNEVCLRLYPPLLIAHLESGA